MAVRAGGNCPSNSKNLEKKNFFSGTINELFGQDQVSRNITIEIIEQTQLKFEVKTFLVYKLNLGQK